MPIEPRTESDIVDAVESRLRGRIRKLTNFASTSFNSVFLRSFATAISRYEMKLLSAQLSGWVDYAGKEITESDLNELGITVPDRDLLNEFQSESDLEQLAQIVGVDRGSGVRATGTVTIQTASDTTQIPEGMSVSTGPDVDGNTNIYRVDADTDGSITEDSVFTTEPNDGETEITLPVIADDVGIEYNAGVGSVTFLPGPPPGVESVSNTVAIDGGEGEQPLDEFRSDIKSAVSSSSGGGTVAGIEGEIEDEIDTVNAVQITENFDTDPVIVDVVVSGGDETTVKSVIERARPAGVKHRLIRPTEFQVGADISVNGSISGTDSVEDAVERYISDTELGDNLVGDKIIQTVMNSSDAIQNISSINTRIVRVTRERKSYESGTDVYQLDTPRLGDITEQKLYTDTVQNYTLSLSSIDTSSLTITAPVGGVETTLVEGTDYTVSENVGPENETQINFTVGGDSPDTNRLWTASYRALSVGPETVSATVSGVETTLIDGTDFTFIDDDGDGFLDSIDFSIGGENPDPGTQFLLSYKVNKTFENDLRIVDRAKIVPNVPEITVTANE